VRSQTCVILRPLSFLLVDDRTDVEPETFGHGER
jgi:hypothetical protein